MAAGGVVEIWRGTIDVIYEGSEAFLNDLELYFRKLGSSDWATECEEIRRC